MKLFRSLLLTTFLISTISVNAASFQADYKNCGKTYQLAGRTVNVPRLFRVDDVANYTKFNPQNGLFVTTYDEYDRTGADALISTKWVNKMRLAWHKLPTDAIVNKNGCIEMHEYQRYIHH